MPAAPISAVEIVAYKFVVLVTVVALATPLKLRTAPGAKSDPVAVIWKGREPATAVVGKMEVTVGTG